jgi:carbon dioxide concentrating mechanism protein CcmN
MVQTPPKQRNPATHYIGANVELGPDVVVATGAVLEAAPESRLRIEAGVCIGSGTVIQVYGGELTIAAGANVGPEVLLVGTGHVGERACIGAESTVLYPDIEADAVIPARSLIGDRGRSMTPPPATTEQNGHAASAHDTHNVTTGPFAPAADNGNTGQPDAESSSDANNTANGANGTGQTSAAGTPEEELTAAKLVYGREQVMQLVKTLFPHRDLLNEADDPPT